MTQPAQRALLAVGAQHALSKLPLMHALPESPRHILAPDLVLRRGLPILAYLGVPPDDAALVEGGP